MENQTERRKELKQLIGKELKFPKSISICISEYQYNFLKKNKINPSRLFRDKLDEVMD